MNSIQLKKCTKCKNDFPATLEYFQRHHKNGLTSHCRKCRSLDKKEQSIRNRKKHLVEGVSLIGKKLCPLCNKWLEKTYFSIYRSNADGLWTYCKNCDAKQKKKYAFNLPIIDYERLLNAQRGCCKICRILFSDQSQISVDIHPQTKIVRGLLCPNCNSLIAHLLDDCSIIESAIRYLQKYDHPL